MRKGLPVPQDLRFQAKQYVLISATCNCSGYVFMQGVIGAGAAGLVAARELAREGHQPTVFEQGCRPGGVWVYTDAVEEAAMPGEEPCIFWS